MRITNILWTEDSILHIARYKVSPEEVEDVCFSGSAKVERGRERFYYITGRTESGRYLFTVVKLIKPGQVKVITSRDMDGREKARYKRR